MEKVNDYLINNNILSNSSQFQLNDNLAQENDTTYIR